MIIFIALSVFAQQEDKKQELMNVDAQFSKISEARGVNEAFTHILPKMVCFYVQIIFRSLVKKLLKKDFSLAPIPVTR